MDVVKPQFTLSEFTGDYGTLANLNAIWTAVAGPFSSLDASGNAGLSKSYMDGSLAVRDAYIAKINTSLGSPTTGVTGFVAAINSSIGVFLPLVNAINASLGTLEKSAATNASVNLAFYANASLGYTSQLTLVENTSIGILTSRHNFTETSLGVLTSRHNFTETSLGSLTTFVGSINSSVGANPVVHYRPDLGVGLRNASGNLYDLVQINSSMYLKVSATNWAQWAVANPSLG